MVGKTQQIVVRLEPELLRLADEVTATVESATGVPTPRASVLRIALRRGLEAMRDELTGKRKRAK